MEEPNMPCFAGLDVSKGSTQICIIDADGTTLREGAVDTTPKAIIGFLRGERRRYVRVGLETGNMSSWLYEGLSKARLPVVCVDAEHASVSLKTQRNKTDRNDAQGLAAIMRSGAYKSTHIKSAANRIIRAMLSSRELLVAKGRDTENAVRSVLHGLGLRIAKAPRTTFSERARAMVVGDAVAGSIIEPLLRVQAAIAVERDAIKKALESIAKADPICARLMTAPQIGPLTALTFRCAVDEPLRFKRSRSVGAHFGMTPRTRQSGETSSRGRISRWGDGSVRRMLYLAASGLFRKRVRPSWLVDWAMEVAARRGRGRAIIATARRLAVILHQMWVSETDFRWERGLLVGSSAALV
jgi:transposase